ncbi:MAG: TetR/AcrR family transcriptional regulator [Acidimicrobiales bacterium]
MSGCTGGGTALARGPARLASPAAPPSPRAAPPARRAAPPALLPSPAVRLPGSRTRPDAGRPLPRGRHGFPPGAVLEYQRVRLLDAFTAEVSRSGYPETRVSKVCAAAGTSSKTFYAHFTSKEACLLAAFDDGAALVCDHGALAYRRAAGPPGERVMAAVEVMLGILAGNLPFARLAIVEVPRLGTTGTRRIDAAAGRCFQQLGVEPRTGALPELPPEACVSTVVGGAVGLLARHVTAGTSGSLAALAPVLCRWLSPWLSGPGSDPPAAGRR